MSTSSPYPLVCARFSGTALDWLGSTHASKVAGKVDMHTFAAIKFPAEDLVPPFHFPAECLAIISSLRPPEESPFYVAIWPNQDGHRPAIRIEPSLPSPGNLYVHTTSFVTIKAQPGIPSSASQYVVAEEDRNRLVQYMDEDYTNLSAWIAEERKRKGRTGTDEPVAPDWDTFSGPTHTETMNRPFTAEIELSGIETLDISSSLAAPYDDLEKMERIISDYSWRGASAVINLVREYHKTESISVSEFSAFTKGSGGTPEDAVKGSSAAELCSLTAVIGGDVPATIVIKPEDVPGPVGWDDDDNDEDWEPELPEAPEQEGLDLNEADLPAIRVICFDIYGSLIDREGGLSDMVRSIAKDTDIPIAYPIPDILDRYIEQEALRIRKTPGAPYSEVIMAAIRDVIPAGIADIGNRDATAVFTWRLWPEVSDTLRRLQARGYRLVALPNVDPDTFSHVQPQLETAIRFDAIVETSSAEGICMAKDDIYNAVIAKCADSFQATPGEILVVSTAAYKCLEPSALLGMATAWVRREGTLEGREELASLVAPKPAVTVKDLEQLSEILQSENEGKAEIGNYNKI